MLFACNKQRLSNQDKAKQASISEVGASANVTILSASERQSFYVWLYKEMYEQIFLKSEQNPKDISAWINVLNQGGSIEGVYHGLILSTQYSNLERGSVSLPAIRFLGEELSWLKKPEDTEKAEKERKELAQKIAQENIRNSLFTIKRTFGEFILQEIEKRKNDRAALSKWYAAIAVRWSNKDVNFGMNQRNKADFDFHKNWATTNSIGMIQWELLNRVHRLFNHYGGVVSPSAVATGSKSK